MEDWQRKHINENLHKLASMTYVNKSLLAILVNADVLSRQEVVYLEAYGRGQGQVSTAYKLYEILLTRIGSYDCLLRALLDTNQTGTAHLLQQGKDKLLYPSSQKLEAGESDSKSDVYVGLHNATKYLQYKSSSHDDKEIKFTFIECVEGFSTCVDEPNIKLVLISTISPQLTAMKLKDTSTVEFNLEPIHLWKPSQSQDLLSRLKTHISKTVKKKPSMLYLYEDDDQNIHKNKGKNLDPSAVYIQQIKDFYISDCSKAIILYPEYLHDSLKEHCKTIFADRTSVAIMVDKFHWEQLSISTREKLLTRQVGDQGKLITLDKFCKTFVYEKPHHFKQTLLQNGLLVDLLKDNKPVIFRQTIPPVRGNYVKRRQRSRSIISKSIFKSSPENEIFVFSNFHNLNELQRIAEDKREKVDTVQHQIQKSILTASFMLLEYQSDADDICQKFASTKTIHFINYQRDKDRLIWEKTIGSNMDCLHSNICVAQDQNKLTEKDLLMLLISNSQKQPIIICHSPGIGKSILLARLALKARKSASKEPSLLLFYICSDFITAINSSIKTTIKAKDLDATNTEMLDCILKEKIFSIASNYLINDEVYLESFNMKQTTLYLFFDGLDEVPTNCLDLALKCFKRLREIFHHARIQITTRPHLLHKVESTFQTLGYNIKENFLTKYWSHDFTVKKQGFNTELLKLYTQNCLSLLKTTLSQQEIDIAGIPLQCLLIAEVYEEEARKYADFENRQLAKDAKPSIRITSITDLYDHMVEKKLLTFAERFLIPDNRILFKRPFKNLHKFLSIQAVFPDTPWLKKLAQLFLKAKTYTYLKNMLPKWKASEEDFKNGEIPRDDLLSIGLVEAVGDGKIQFIHRTFAEYFLACYTTENLTDQVYSKPEIVIEFIDNAVLQTTTENHTEMSVSFPQDTYRFKLPVVTHFINTLLSYEDCSFLTPTETVIMSRNHERILQASIINDFPEILQLYLVHHQKNNNELVRTLLTFASKYSSPALFDLLGYDKVLFENCYPTLIHMAAEKGNLEMFTHLWSKYDFKSDIKNWTTSKTQDLIRVTVESIINLNAKIIKNKCKILELLEIDYPNTISKSTKDDLIHILEMNVNVNILIKLISYIESDDLSEEANATKLTILHVPATYLTPSEYYRLLTAMSSQHKSVLHYLTWYKNVFGETPLQHAFRYLEVNIPILEFFQTFEAQFDKIDELEYTAAWTAIRFNIDFSILLSILSKSNISYKDRFGKSLFHVAAQHMKNEKDLKKLIDYGLERELSIEEEDKYGNTIIFYALRNPSPNKIIRFLYTNYNINLHHLNKRGETILHLATQLGKIKTIDLLHKLTYLSNFSSRKRKNTPLHFALTANVGDQLETVKRFSSDVKALNDNGQCPLMYGMTRKHPDISLEVLEYLEPLISWTPQLAHLACACMSSQKVKAVKYDKERYEKLENKIQTFLPNRNKLLMPNF